MRQKYQKKIQLAEQPAPNAPRSMSGEVGFTGTKIFAGLPMDEYNRDLSFPLSTKVYDQMRRSDGQIAAILMAMKLPIRSTKWYLEPDKDAKDSNLAEQIADFIKDNLMGGMKYSWDDHLREALLMLDFGFSVFEKVYRYDTWNGRPVVMIDKYAPRVASSIWRFPQDEDYNIIMVQQINYMTGQIVDIPLDKCRVYTYNREGDNVVGISALRPAYKHWYIKDALYSVMSVGIEKALIGTPYGKLPKGTSDEDRDKVLNLLSAVRVAEEAGFTIPEDVTVDMLEGKKSPLDALPFIEHQDTLIARSVLAQFINLGTMSSASGGAYALGQTMADMFVMGLEAVANYIENEVQKDVEDLVKWNFGSDAPIPKLKHKNISFKDMSQVAQALYWLGSGHLVTPDEDLENYVRDMFGIPPLPKEALKNQQAMPPSKNTPQIVPDEKGNITPPKPPAVQKMEEVLKFADDAFPIDDSGGEKEEPAGTTKWRRDLTPNEKTVNLDELNDRWQTAEEQMADKMRGVLRQSADQLINEITKILETNQSVNQKMQAINSLQAKYGPKYVDVIKSAIQDLYQYGADSVVKELSATVEAPPAPQSDLSQLYTKAGTVATMQLSQMQSTIQLGAINQLSRGVDNKHIIHSLKLAADAYIQGPGIQSAATITVGESINVGRGATAKALGVKGAQWSAILDSKTCPLCEELDNKTISADNPDFDIFRPPLHSSCRCILIYLGNNNTGEEYNWVTPPASLVKKHGHLIT
jgi:SPP1 gp7 family putative phage head morphogenesis protein